MNKQEAVSKTRELLKIMQSLQADPCDNAMDILSNVMSNSSEFEEALDVVLNELHMSGNRKHEKTLAGSV